MTVSTISSLTAGLSRTLNNQNARVTSSLQSLGADSRDLAASIDVSDLPASNELKSKTTNFRATAQNLAQSSALIAVASGGIKQIAEGLDRLQQLSTQASSGAITDNDREALNTEFQAIRQQIDRIAKTTQFGGQPLLDGSLNAAGGEGSPTLSIASLTNAALFGEADISLATAQDAASAQIAVAGAQRSVAEQRSVVGAAGENLQFATASVNSAIQNQEAAASTLSDADFAPVAAESAASRIQAAAIAALQAQTNRLQPSALTMLVE